MAGGAAGAAVRITPACAGSTQRQSREKAQAKDHPRLRGEHLRALSAKDMRIGSPPPARGAQGDWPTEEQAVRITPACAGSTVLQSI